MVSSWCVSSAGGQGGRDGRGGRQYQRAGTSLLAEHALTLPSRPAGQSFVYRAQGAFGFRADPIVDLGSRCGGTMAGLVPLMRLAGPGPEPEAISRQGPTGCCAPSGPRSTSRER